MTNRKTIELLAPVGNFAVLQSAIKAGADAVYLGGKLFNMRLHRQECNFDLKALNDAIQFAHDHGVQIHITVNNLIQEKELPVLEDYLQELDALGPDALIIQDLSIAALAQELNLSVPLHASVMQNTHNGASLEYLKTLGFSRVVLGRELSLEQIRHYHNTIDMELEYFIHGDMCIAHSGQCYHSGLLFGQSSNRGRCLKPCRWPYELIDLKKSESVATEKGPFKMALKDMCLYPHLPELIEAGVSSFKIEGRMRTPDFVHKIVSFYREAIDRYLSDREHFKMNEDSWQKLQENRVRDFTSCYAFGNPGSQSIGYDGQREPRFFSQAVKEPPATKAFIPKGNFSNLSPAKLSVRVSTVEQAKAALKGGAQRIYLGGEAFRPNSPLQANDYEEALTAALDYKAEMVFATPRIMMENVLHDCQKLFELWNELKPAGILVANIGLLYQGRNWTDLPFYGDYTFNLLNHLSAELLKQTGLVAGTVALEGTAEIIADLLNQSSIPLDVIVHGPLEAMVTDHCFLHANDSDPGHCLKHCFKSHFGLRDTADQVHRLAIDQYCRTHILLAKDLCLYSYLTELKSLGANHFRIEGQHETPANLEKTVTLYQERLANSNLNKSSEFPFASEAVTSGVFRHEALL